MLKRNRLHVSGIVQGVGFRPFVARLAKHSGLTGWVFNHSQGVTIEVQGSASVVQEFSKALVRKAPGLAKIESVRREVLPTREENDFLIRKSDSRHERQTLIPPDIATCELCMKECFDPANRRFLYPFTNCTQCGPRFTIVQSLPYDRSRTTMNRFHICPLCEREFNDPGDRRYHAQPNACPECGPQVFLSTSSGEPVGSSNPIKEAASRLQAGHIVGVKGLGGFHLACNALDPRAVCELRRRKKRIQKPFAVMFPNVVCVSRYCQISEEEKQLLLDPARPIVLLRRNIEAELPEELAPGLTEIGALLPYTPLHALLLHEATVPLVMTSGNLSEEPIACENEQALRRLGALVDCFLMHDRDIPVRCDDSVARVWSGKPIVFRRSRGYTPLPLTLPITANKPILACGALLKNTFCLLKGNKALLSHHIGDLENLESMTSYEAGIKHFQELFDCNPQIVAHDLHPDFPSTRFAKNCQGVSLIPVQHHHAHFASGLAEHGLTEKAIGICWDGVGLGEDGTVWGAEFLVGDLIGYERAARFRPVPMPGGDATSREPWRMALVYLREAFGKHWRSTLSECKDVRAAEINTVERMLDIGLNIPFASSMGRLFDAFAFICLGISRSSYEGQAPMLLEHLASATNQHSQELPFEIHEHARLLEIDPRPAIRKAVALLDDGERPSGVAWSFHASVAEVAARVCEILRDADAPSRVVLTGGCFQNMLLLSLLTKRLKTAGFEVLTHSQVPPNDGGIALGQAAVACARTQSEG